MRGEDRGRLWNEAMTVGSPPHARGRPQCGLDGSEFGGITPACAGKTPANAINVICFPDHPRMRGEDAKLHLNSLYGKGSPPHARGRHGLGVE